MTPEFGQTSLRSCRQEPSSARRSCLCPTVWRTWRPRMSYMFNCVSIASGLAGRPSLRTGHIRKIQNRIGEQLASAATQKASDGPQLAFSEKGAAPLTSRAARWVSGSEPRGQNTLDRRPWFVNGQVGHAMTQYDWLQRIVISVQRGTRKAQADTGTKSRRQHSSETTRTQRPEKANNRSSRTTMAGPP
jgi:hypothetical protein